jgi:hypothetical protein
VNDSQRLQQIKYAFDPVAWAEDVIHFEPDTWQADVMRATQERLLLNCSRQSGKSSTAAALALWTALYRPGSLTLLLSPSQRQSNELFGKVADCLDEMKRPPKLLEDNKLSLRLKNRSRIVSLPSTQKIRGFSAPKLVIADEAAQIPDMIYSALSPMFATSQRYRFMMMSSPFGRTGRFFEACEDPVSGGWKKWEIPASSCPRICESFLEQERRDLGEMLYQQEYECKFHDLAGGISAFNPDDWSRCLSESVRPLDMNALMGVKA